jgi:hypothetical protein
MEIAGRSIEAELARVGRWAGTAHDWDLAQELDTCKQSRDSIQRQIGLLGIESDRRNYDSLVSRNKFNQAHIDVIELEIMKRRGMF